MASEFASLEKKIARLFLEMKSPLQTVNWPCPAGPFESKVRESFPRITYNKETNKYNDSHQAIDGGRLLKLILLLCHLGANQSLTLSPRCHTRCALFSSSLSPPPPPPPPPHSFGS